MTAEEFCLTQTEDPPLELVRGQPVLMRLCGGVHGWVKARVGTLLYEWSNETRGVCVVLSGRTLVRSFYFEDP